MRLKDNTPLVMFFQLHVSLQQEAVRLASLQPKEFLDKDCQAHFKDSHRERFFNLYTSTRRKRVRLPRRGMVRSRPQVSFLQTDPVILEGFGKKRTMKGKRIFSGIQSRTPRTRHLIQACGTWNGLV